MFVDTIRLLTGIISLMLGGGMILYRKKLIEAFLASQEGFRKKLGFRHYRFEEIFEKLFVRTVLLAIGVIFFFGGIWQIYLALSAP